MSYIIDCCNLVIDSLIQLISFNSSNYSEGPAKWFFLGYIFYMILVVVIVATAIFQNHREVNMAERIRRSEATLTWIHKLYNNIIICSSL